MNTRLNTLIAATALMGSLLAAVPAHAGTATGQSAADIALANKVMQELGKDPKFQGKLVDINVAANGGHVALTGWVDVATDASAARMEAAQVAGVTGWVDSNLKAYKQE